MIKGIDHIVIAVHDLDATIETYTQLGFVVVEGGRHPTGSYNALIGFADGAYIELLAFYEESPDHPWWDLLHQRGGGLIDFCMQTDDIRADHAKFRELGVDMSDIVDLSRKRPDGYELAWINNKTYGDYQGLVPFVIEDKTPREERVPKETNHSNGVTGIDTMTFATNRIDIVESVMGEMLGDGKAVQYDDLNAKGLRFEVGTHALEYLQPIDDSSPLHAHINNNAPVPYRVSFKTSAEPKQFSPDQTDGVRMRFV